MCKSLHAGHASAVGLRAARLAARGFTGVSDVLERDDGFAQLYAGAWSPERVLDDAHIPRVLGIVYKYHASYGTQAPIDACLQLRAGTGCRPQDVVSLEATVERQYLDVCGISEPRTASEAKFSIAHMAALALAGRSTVSPETFTPAALADPELAALRARVQVRGDDAMPRANAEAVLICADGSRYSHHCDASTPERDLGRQEARLIEKARTLLMPRMGARRSAALIDGVLDINGEIDVAGFMARMHGALAAPCH